MNNRFRLWRDPAFLLNLFAAVVMFLSTFFLHLSSEQQSLLNAAALALAGVWVSWKVSDGQLALLVGLFKALMALALGFGLHWTDEQQLTVMTLLTALATAFVRTQVGSPLPPPPSTAQPVADVSVASMNKRP